MAINALCAFEAFVGVCYASFASAIIFSKIARIKSIAQVEFSDPICVRYCTGVLEKSGDESGDSSSDEDEEEAYPCPVLEFRIINQLWQKRGGEIMNATVNVVASKLEHHDQSESLRMGKAKLHRQASQASADSWRSFLSTRSLNTKDDSLHSVRNGPYLSVRNLTAAVDSPRPQLGGTVSRKKPLPTRHEDMDDSERDTLVNLPPMLNERGANMLGSRHQRSGSVVQLMNQMMAPSSSSSFFLDNDSAEVEPEDTRKGATGTLSNRERELVRRMSERLVDSLEIEQLRLDDEFEETRSVAPMEEDSTLAPKQVFHKLDIETARHPFFKRRWFIRHRLDASSPLLSNRARKLIEANGGNWPKVFNNYKSVRKHLKFHEIIVNISGTSNNDGSAVFAQKVYDYVDVNIGYAFAPVLTVTDDNTLMVDASLINDVFEQRGGGAEPFQAREGCLLQDGLEDDDSFEIDISSSHGHAVDVSMLGGERSVRFAVPAGNNGS